MDASAADAPSDAPKGAIGLTDAGTLDRMGWTAVANPDHVPPGMTMPHKTESLVTSNAFDGNLQTRWATGVSQFSLTFPLYFTVDMNAVTTVSRITLHAGSDKNDYPGTMDVAFSTDGTNFATVVTGHVPTLSASGVDTISIPTTAPATQYIQLKATAARNPPSFWWAIGELNVYP